MKYIIEIEDVPFSKVSFADTGAQNINLYRAKGFNSLVFDQFGLDKLIPLEKKLEETYQRGLDDAWEAARKIAQQWEEDADTENKIVIDDSIRITLDSMIASEAIAKLREYEQQKADEIKVGDEVKDRTDDCGVVTWIYGNDAYVLWQDGSTGNYAADELIKTGRHFNFLASLLNAMKEGAE